MQQRVPAVYARQSVDKPDSISVESQIDFCKYELRGRAFKQYCDKGYSGKNTDRPQFQQLIREAGRPVSVLNLFAYTGGATLAAAAAGASVCHVDASKGMTSWARENAVSSHLSDKPIRWIVDDCKKFIEREIRRGRRYDAIIMDPPSYGRGPSGETWKIENDVAAFVARACELLSDRPLFVLVSSYSAGLAPSVMAYLLGITAGKKYHGTIAAQELGLPVESTGLVLPCGSSARFIGA